MATVLLRDVRTKLFLKDPVNWVETQSEALQFESTLEAMLFRQKHNLRDTEYYFGDTDYHLRTKRKSESQGDTDAGITGTAS